jgi:glycosyltransferase involved in cell wall biosynthesis
MKIAYITRGPFGSLGGNAAYMIPTIAAEVHQIMVLSPIREGQSKNTKKYVVYPAGDLDVRSLHQTGMRERAIEASAHIEAFDPDIVHVFNHPQCVFYPLIGRRRSARRRRWLVDIRTPLLIKQPNRGREHRRNIWLQFLWDRVSTHTDESVRTVFPLCLRRVTEVPLGVDLSQFRSERLTFHPPRRFVFAGSIAPMRRLETMIEGFANLIARTPHPISLDVFGDGPAFGEISALVARLGVGERIFLNGMIDQTALFRQLPEFDAGIAYIPNGQYDRAPALKLIEYAAAGLQIFASRTMFNARMADEGLEITLFENTPDAMADTILQSLETPLSRSTVERNRAAVTAYDWHAIVEQKVYPLYDRMLRRGLSRFRA